MLLTIKEINENTLNMVEKNLFLTSRSIPVCHKLLVELKDKIDIMSQTYIIVSKEKRLDPEIFFELSKNGTNLSEIYKKYKFIDELVCDDYFFNSLKKSDLQNILTNPNIVEYEKNRIKNDPRMKEDDREELLKIIEEYKKAKGPFYPNYPNYPNPWNPYYPDTTSIQHPYIHWTDGTSTGNFNKLYNDFYNKDNVNPTWTISATYNETPNVTYSCENQNWALPNIMSIMEFRNI